MNLANKLRFQNFQVFLDMAGLEAFAVAMYEQNFDLMDMVEESMAKTLQYERLLHKNGIKIPSLEATVDSSSSNRKVVDKAPVKYVE